MTAPKPLDSSPSGWVVAATDAVEEALPQVGAVRVALAALSAPGGHVLAPGPGSEPAGHVLPSMPPHAWAIAVHEIVSSARKAGTWRDVASGYVPVPGDAIVLKRGGQDPRTQGQEGHVGRIELVTVTARVSIDGNHANQCARVTRRADDPEIVGYVECGEWGPRALARAQSQVGVREATGKNDGPRIALYFVGAMRGGRRTGFVPGWNWCAAFLGWSLLGE